MRTCQFCPCWNKRRKCILATIVLLSSFVLSEDVAQNSEPVGQNREQSRMEALYRFLASAGDRIGNPIDATAVAVDSTGDVVSKEPVGSPSKTEGRLLDEEPKQQQNEKTYETLICPTATQTVYLRPKTVTMTRTVQLLRAPTDQIQGAGQSIDFLTASAITPPPRDKDTTCLKPTTEFRSFVYISTQFIHKTLTDYATHTVAVPINVPPETITQYNTVFVPPETVTQYKTMFAVQNEARPSIQYQYDRQPSDQQLQVTESLPITIVTTVTVMQPAAECRNGDNSQQRDSQREPTTDADVVDQVELRPTPVKRCRYYPDKTKARQMQTQTATVRSSNRRNYASRNERLLERWKRQFDTHNYGYVSDDSRNVQDNSNTYIDKSDLSKTNGERMETSYYYDQPTTHRRRTRKPQSVSVDIGPNSEEILATYNANADVSEMLAPNGHEEDLYSVVC